MTTEDGRAAGRLFDEVPELYDRVRPTYPDELFADLAAITGVRKGSSVLEVGCGTGQATRSLALRGFQVSAVEAGEGMAALAHQRLGSFGSVQIEHSRFEDWESRGRRFDLLLAAASWHWVEPAVGWRKAHDVLRPGGGMVLIGNVVVRRPGETEVYAETADLHERFAPGNPDWGHPPLEDEAREVSHGWGPGVEDPGSLFGPTTVRWYPMVQWFDGAGFADLLRTASIYRRLTPEVREPLLQAIAERIRTRMGDRVPRRYLAQIGRDGGGEFGKQRMSLRRLLRQLTFDHVFECTRARRHRRADLACKQRGIVQLGTSTKPSAPGRRFDHSTRQA